MNLETTKVKQNYLPTIISNVTMKNCEPDKFSKTPITIRFYYINTNEIPSELSRENLIS